MFNRPLYIDKIQPYIGTPFVKILTGIRRCGKSTILKLLMKKLEEEINVRKINSYLIKKSIVKIVDFFIMEECKKNV